VCLSQLRATKNRAHKVKRTSAESKRRGGKTMNKYQIVFVNSAGKMIYKAYDSEAAMVNAYLVAERLFAAGKIVVKPVTTQKYGD